LIVNVAKAAIAAPRELRKCLHRCLRRIVDGGGGFTGTDVAVKETDLKINNL
jgi:hypothetical protein